MSLDRFYLLLVLASTAGILSSCGAPAATMTPVATAATPSPAVKAGATASPTATPIPGFEGWSVVNPQDVKIQSDSGSLILTLTHRALWFMEQRGVLVYKPVSGDFKITADVYTSKRSDTTRPPGGDGSVQLGGIMARSGNGSQENYVFIVVGDDGNGLSVETKNTVNGLSKFEGPDWGSPDAELRLCRFGQTITLYKRHVGTDGAWMRAASFERADLPQTLQAGMNIYTDSDPDLQVRYDHISIESIASQSACVK